MCTISELSTFQEWIRYRYGTFAESGFENDPLYPLMYQYGAEEKSSQSCGNLTQNDFSGDQMVDASIEQHKVSTSNALANSFHIEGFDFHAMIFSIDFLSPPNIYQIESRYFKQQGHFIME